jgi:hypothetical protein
MLSEQAQKIVDEFSHQLKQFRGDESLEIAVTLRTLALEIERANTPYDFIGMLRDYMSNRVYNLIVRIITSNTNIKFNEIRICHIFELDQKIFFDRRGMGPKSFIELKQGIIQVGIKIPPDHWLNEIPS